MPFVTVMDPPTGGRLALAAINAGIFTIAASFSIGVIGWPGLLVPVWMYLAASPFTSRVIRLRPELVALVIILAAITFRPRHRALYLGFLAFLFTITYTAFHVFLALCLVWFACEWLRLRRRPDLALAISPLMGCVIGFVARPHVLGYARIWWAQNILFFLHKNQLDVGDEIFAPDGHFLVRCIPWILGLVALLLAGGRRGAKDHRIVNLSATAVLFVVLFVLMARMITYVVPLVTLAVVGSLQPLMSVRRALAITAILVIGICVSLAGLDAGTDYVPDFLFSRDVSPELFWERTGHLLPREAKVAASWGNGDLFAYWAPQARYLNMLDPIFMYAPFPRQQNTWRRVVNGLEPDIAHAVASTLDSDFLLINPLKVSRTLRERLARDPRFFPVAASENGLYTLKPAPGAFVMDWRTMEGRLYPRAVDQRGRAFEGFVAIERLGRQRCVVLVHDDPPHPNPTSWEFAPYAQSLLRVDGRNIVGSQGTPGAILGRGFSFHLPPSARTRRFEVQTCSGADGVGGFYLLQRD
jgi:hypothetical protein